MHVEHATLLEKGVHGFSVVIEQATAVRLYMNFGYHLFFPRLLS